MRYVHVKTDGTETEVSPADGKKWSVAELQKLVGGTFDYQVIPNVKGVKAIYLNDNGKLEGQDLNNKASVLWRTAYPIDKYPYNNDGLIVGDVVVVYTK